MAAKMFVDVGDEVQREIDAARQDVEACFAEILAWLVPPKERG